MAGMHKKSLLAELENEGNSAVKFRPDWQPRTGQVDFNLDTAIKSDTKFVQKGHGYKPAYELKKEAEKQALIEDKEFLKYKPYFRFGKPAGRELQLSGKAKHWLLSLEPTPEAPPFKEDAIWGIPWEGYCKPLRTTDKEFLGLQYESLEFLEE